MALQPFDGARRICAEAPGNKPIAEDAEVAEVRRGKDKNLVRTVLPAKGI
jgi:hypothetical protein